MARPLKYAKDELLDLVVEAAEDLARAHGLRGVVMREIMKRVKASGSTVYDSVGDLDHVILKVNERTLERLRAHLARLVSPRRRPLANALAVADGYMDFVMREPRLWGMVFEHSMPHGAAPPDWYMASLARTTGLVDQVLRPLIPDATERHRSVAALWAALQGIASLAVTGKLAVVNKDDPRDLARLLVSRYLGGLDGRP